MHGNGCLQSLITPIRSMRWEVLAMWKLPRDHRVILSRALDLSRQHQTKDVLSFRKDMKFWMQLPSVHARKHQVPAQYWFDPLHEGKHGRTLHEHGSPETDSCHPPIGKILWRIDWLGKYPMCGLLFLCPIPVLLMPFWFGAVPQFQFVWQHKAWDLDMKNATSSWSMPNKSFWRLDASSSVSPLC